MTDSDKKIEVIRQPHLAPKIVFVDGQPGCGKTMLSPIIAALDRVEILNMAYEIEYVCALVHLNKIEMDAAISLIRMFTDLKLYHTMMSRETNFRPGDLSSVFRDSNPLRYFKRLFAPGDESIPDKVKEEKPILNLTTHNLTSFCEPIFNALQQRVVLIEVVRHPLYMLKQQVLNMERLIEDVRDFTIYYRYEKRSLPYFVYGWEDIFVNANKVEQAIYSIEKMYQRSENNKVLFEEKFNSNIITIPFECYVINPDNYMVQITRSLETKMTTSTFNMMKKQNVPRKLYSDGIGLKIYKRCGWQPPMKNSDELREFEVRRNFAVEHSSKKAVEVLDRVSRDYEKKYMGGIKKIKGRDI